MEYLKITTVSFICREQGYATSKSNQKYSSLETKRLDMAIDLIRNWLQYVRVRECVCVRVGCGGAWVPVKIRYKHCHFCYAIYHWFKCQNICKGFSYRKTTDKDTYILRTNEIHVYKNLTALKTYKINN